ncbi:deoxyribodipyrimidine photo-lyase [Desulfotalea psychrophila]|uniref:Deoxyribodipyrimidine photo-lyase n=1 Tax=Desulfotalea psychrophila (strain LSv54 / DSM 12343) TaxID=177439 RepID=Q6AK21_DESPS|nr:deoxyribodipyrimidine photo-lyase [Desulfotalea psychrophila]CAG37305.1 probable DNA photolyase [Desulfotalea psychrophila LSv54]
MDINRRNKDIVRRGRRLKNGRRGDGPVVYWVSRDQRVRDNWALLWAQQEAISRQKGLLVVFCLVPDYLGAKSSQYLFMLRGLARMQKKLHEMNIHFTLFEQSPDDILPGFLRQIDAHLLVSDFDPLRIKRQWTEQLIAQVVTPIYQVDTHNIIPAWMVSDKKEYAAYTIRPKIKRLLDDFLTDIPPLQHHPFSWAHTLALAGSSSLARVISTLNSSGCELRGAGEASAQFAADSFIKIGLENYSERRNNPCLNGQSGLSPYLHFGHLSAQRLAWVVSRDKLPIETKEPFLEELIVRRELSDNFCLYEPLYDTFAGFPAWARKSLDQHRCDERAYLYSFHDLEAGNTHEQLWNACQIDLVQSGKLHGYLRMYWAKKILEWTPNPETALEYAIRLNDRYSLDGRDPNGYAGVAWSIGGVHDRAWAERPVFGKIRYMNEAGCRRKFDVNSYMSSVFARERE